MEKDTKSESMPSIMIMCKVYGPESDLLGKSRHMTALAKELRSLPERAYSAELARVVFFFTVGGRFEHSMFKKPITSEVRRVSLSSDKVLCVEIGVETVSLISSDSEFREHLISLIEAGFKRAVQYLAKKRICFDEQTFSEDLQTAFEMYRKLALPLPMTYGEKLTHFTALYPQRES